MKVTRREWSPGRFALASVIASLACGAAVGPTRAAESDSLVTSAWRALRAEAYVEAESLSTRWLESAPTVPPDSALYGLAQEIVFRARLERGRWRVPGTDASARNALRLRDRVLEPLSLDRMRLEAALGRYYRRTSALDLALLHTQRVLSINEQVFGAKHVECGKAWGNIANIRGQMGDLDGAIAANQRVVEIMRASLPADDLMIAMAEHNLALAYKATADYAAATDLLEDALRILEAKLAADDPRLADGLHALAIVRIEAGDLARAHELEARALAIREAKLAPDDHVLGTSLTTMANVRREEGDLEAAMPLYERALAIEERSFGPDHPELMTELFNLGSAYQLTGRHDRALALFDRYLAVVREKTPENRVALAEGLAARGGVLRDDGKYAAAERDLRSAVALADSALGQDHPDLASDHLRLSTLYARTARPDSAMAELFRAEEIGRASLALNLRAWPERDALLYARRRPSGRNRAITATVAQPDSRWVTPTWNAVLRARSMVVDELAARRRVLSSGDGRARAILAELQQVARQLSRALIKGPDRDPTRYLAHTDSLRGAADRLERDLSNADARPEGQVSRYLIERADLASLAHSMPVGAALVAYVRYDSIGLDTASDDAVAIAQQGDEETHPRYAAFVLPAGGAAPRTVPLGRAASIEGAVTRWMSAADPANFDPAAGDRETAAGQALRRAIWDPVIAEAGAPTDLYLVPDGVLEWVNPAALPDDAGEPLALGGPLIHLESAERDLLREAAPRAKQGGGLLVLGGVDYEAASKPGGAAPAGNSAAFLFRGEPPNCESFRDLRFGPLPGSKREVERVAAIWKRAAREDRGAVRRLEGRDATEEEWKRAAPGRRVLHLATHGFFVDQNCIGGAAPGLRGVGALGSPIGAGGSDRIHGQAAIESPLRLAGFALAGANRRAETGADQDDGILTAEEIAALDLSSVDVAVLSGCETARGELIASEGVGGLRRAFRTAGAGAIVASLWSVRDDDAALWMERFYLDHLKEHRSTAEAARAASLALREHLLAAGEEPRVARWAAFLAVGD